MVDTFANGEQGACSTEGTTTKDNTIPNGTIEIEMNPLQNLSANGPTTLPDQLSTQETQQGNIPTNKVGPGSIISTQPNSIHSKSQAPALPVQMNAQQGNVTTDNNKPSSSIGVHSSTNPKPQTTVSPHQNNIQQNGSHINIDEVDKRIGNTNMKPNPPEPPKKTSLQVPPVITEIKATIINMPKPAKIDTCLFCLDEGDLIHMCSCSALVHKECALEYIRFPGRRNEDCCQCRKKLEYTVMDKQTPMENRYVIAFIVLLFVYLAMIGLSIYSMTILIPKESMNYYVWLAVIANLSILWPLLIVYLVSLGIDCSCGPRNRESDDWCRDSGCYCSGDCGVGNDCGDCGDMGEGAIVIICVICLIAILIVLIAASAYLVNSLVKLFKSFSLKSKKEIKFKHEKRLLNTLAPNKLKRNLSV